MLSWFVAQVLSECSVMVPVTPLNPGITFAFTFHMPWISIIKSLYFKILSSSLLITFLSPVIAASINMHVPFLLSCIIMSSLLLWIVLSVHTCCFCNMVTLSWLVVTDYMVIPVFIFYFYPTLYHVSLCILLPLLVMLIWCGPLSYQIVYRFCDFYLFLFVIFLSHYIWFIMPGVAIISLSVSPPPPPGRILWEFSM